MICSSVEIRKCRGKSFLPALFLVHVDPHLGDSQCYPFLVKSFRGNMNAHTNIRFLLFT